MKRSPLKRTPFARGFSELKRARLNPISEKKQASNVIERERVLAEGAAFRSAINGEVCVVCGKTQKQAYDATGYGLNAHHAIRQEVLKRRGLHELLWSPDNSVAACEYPCHRRHTLRIERIPRAALPDRVFAFAAKYDLFDELDKEYPQ